MPSAPDLPELAARIAGWARDGEQVEAYVRRSHQTDVRVHEGGIEQLSTAQTEGAGIRVVAGHRQGFAWAGSLDDDVLAETLAEARDNAGFSSPDEFVGLALPDGVEPPAIDPYDPELETFPTAARIDLALDLERRVRAGDGRIRALRNTDYGDGLYTTAIATSTGLAAWSRRSVVSLGTTAIAGEGADTQTGHGYICARRPSDLDVGRAAALAVTRSTRLLGARKPASAQLTAVLEPSVAAAFLSVLAGTLNGESVLKGRSLFVDRLGETVAAPFVSLVEDPGDPTAFTAARYDSEGLASRRVPLIEAGVLAGFLYDAYAGRRAGTASTASAVRGGFKGAPTCGHRAVSLVPGGQSPEEVVAGVELGLLVQTVSGLHSGVNPVSGDFSVGAEGLMIRHGEVAEPVREITIGSTLQRMLKGVVAVGNDREWLLGPAAHVTLAISGITMSGQ